MQGTQNQYSIMQKRVQTPFLSLHGCTFRWETIIKFFIWDDIQLHRRWVFVLKFLILSILFLKRFIDIGLVNPTTYIEQLLIIIISLYCGIHKSRVIENRMRPSKYYLLDSSNKDLHLLFLAFFSRNFAVERFP